MKRLRTLAGLSLLWAIASIPIGPARAQDETLPSPEEDAAIEAAILARRASTEFNQAVTRLHDAQAAYEAAVASIPEVAAVDAELERLHARIRELMVLRDRLVELSAARLAPLEDAMRIADEEALAADPLLPVLDRQRAEAIAAQEPIDEEQWNQP